MGSAFSEHLEEGEEGELRDNTHAHQGLSRLLGQPMEPFSKFTENSSRLKSVKIIGKVTQNRYDRKGVKMMKSKAVPAETRERLVSINTCPGCKPSSGTSTSSVAPLLRF
jgi:hypothetical protein